MKQLHIIRPAASPFVNNLCMHRYCVHCGPERAVLVGKILYTELNQWREAETRRIKDTESGEQRQLSLRDLLQEETRLLHTIERLKTNALQEGKVRRRRSDCLKGPAV